MKSIEVISEEITMLEAIRDNSPEDFTKDNQQMLSVLNLCYDLLTRTNEISNLTVKLSDMDKDLLEEDFDIVPKYAKTSNQLADFSFVLATKQGSVDLRKLLREVIFGKTQLKIAEDINIRQATISDYLTSRKSLTCDNYEKIINYINS